MSAGPAPDAPLVDAAGARGTAGLLPRWVRDRSGLLGRAGIVVLVVVALRNTFDVPFFFDEIWRVDYVTTDHLLQHYFKQNTPIAIGWIVLHRALLSVLPNREVTFHVIGLVWYLAFLELAWRALKADRGRVPVEAAWAFPVLALVPGSMDFVQVFYNYSFEMAYAGLLLFLARPGAPSRARQVGALAALAASGVFVTPAPFLAPWVFLHLWRRRFAPRRWIALGAVLFVGTVAFQYLVFVRPVVDPALASAWRDQRIVLDAGALRRLGLHLLQQTAVTVFQGSPMERALVQLPAWAPPAAMAALLAVGAAALLVTSRTVAAFGGAALLLSACASVATGWPFGPVRVNASFCWIVWYAVLLGWFVALGGAARLARAPAWAGAALALLVASPWAFFAHRPPWTEPFGRGLERDLRVVARSPARTNLVVSYHPMSWYYPEYFLNSRYRSDREFKVVADAWHDDRLYAHLDDVLRAELGRRDAIWCVIPYDTGPAADGACRFSTPGFRKFHDANGKRARVVGFLREGIPAAAR